MASPSGWSRDDREVRGVRGVDSRKMFPGSRLVRTSGSSHTDLFVRIGYRRVLGTAFRNKRPSPLGPVSDRASQVSSGIAIRSTVFSKG